MKLSENEIGSLHPFKVYRTQYTINPGRQLSVVIYCPIRKQEQQEKIRSSTVTLILMEAISVLNVTDPLLMASDPRHTLKTIMKGCICQPRKRKYYFLYSRDRDSLLSEMVRGGA